MINLIFVYNSFWVSHLFLKPIVEEIIDKFKDSTVLIEFDFDDPYESKISFDSLTKILEPYLNKESKHINDTLPLIIIKKEEESNIYSFNCYQNKVIDFYQLEKEVVEKIKQYSFY